MNLCTELPKAAEGDRGHLFAVCDLMTTLAEQSRHEGILALEEWLEYDEASDDTCRIRYPECEKSPLTENESCLFALLLRMIIDGCDCDTVRDVARIDVVMTESNKDPEEWRAIIGNKHRKQELATRFKDNDSPLKIAIVVDMWLTGFDETCKKMLHASEEGKKLGLTDEELAFYDALTKPEAVRDFYTNEDLVALTKELTENLRKNKTIDWQKKESARAKMRMLVKRLLKHINTRRNVRKTH